MRLPILHAVTDDRVLLLPDLIDRARAIALGPEVAIHLRGRVDGGRLLELVERVITAVHGTGTPVIVNDRVDVAVVSRADGVHLPERGMSIADARTLLRDKRHEGMKAWLGCSRHDRDSANAALAVGADWVFLGPILPTASHAGREPLGFGALAGPPKGLVAIGGMDAAAAGRAALHGVRSVAVVRAVWDAADPAGAARDILLSFNT